VLGSTGGGMLSRTGTVEFRASYVQRGGGAGSHVQHGRSRFVREDGRWCYLDELDDEG
jgi:SEC-C motif-containing protein